ncbi:transcriptional regulator with XRE-family HTH domain [Paenibacillus sp. V4I9]|uniref:helix-turn-helix domain-containing protein n=1 Tax=Paenibacillus sp. V4I9 TaxID=3042308 RepID=UPI00278B477A|nr:helix-turn-helix domain-containing protein [Paenibacillus sp. V4I9]MDQ0888531.1 transcriptional regulator with XRE-family HTH domain [Paenibacillus sp. V4I9]
MGDILKVVGARVRDFRKDKGLTQEQLAEVSGFHYTYIGAIERGEKNITLLNLEKLAVSLDTEVQELFRYAEIDLGKETSKQRDLQEVLDLLIRQSSEEIKRAKFILTELYRNK